VHGLLILAFISSFLFSFSFFLLAAACGGGIEWNGSSGA
jgi:hypothetical protein